MCAGAASLIWPPLESSACAGIGDAEDRPFAWHAFQRMVARSATVMPAPATKSFTVLEMSTSPAAARLETRRTGRFDFVSAVGDAIKSREQARAELAALGHLRRAVDELTCIPLQRNGDRHGPHQGLRIFLGRILKHLPSGSVFHELAPAHHGDVVAHAFNHRHVV
jgi:hypothetical protein